ncbi:PREDICTED: tetratricopeptide repeat protein 16 [Dipodomys ordii]|uniref:Tetratricopeptide repeat protein 16 n=1 Tax=Dipodomys ordii TaxID=10020 RepID=A0A1S3FK57_DIPOR|nr:PREDICTED: tetratricopeptide repeat protein 16 [Dipodomys ordii]
MTDSQQGAVAHDKDHSQNIRTPWASPQREDTLKRIFGSSKVFYDPEEDKPRATGYTVPLKVIEYYRRGYKCLEQEQWEQAVLFFSRALHLDSKMIEFYALRAEAFIQVCDFSSAAQNLRKACVLQPENTKYLERLTFVLYLQGQSMFEQCDYLDALNIFLHAFELQPHKACFRYRCMACLLALKRHQDCLAIINKEVKQGTNNADIYLLRARLYNFFQKPKLCYRDLRSALLLEPKHPQARVLLQKMVDQANQAHKDAGILAVQGKLRHALQRINCAIQNNPLDPSFFLFRGTMYRRLQEFDGAVEDFLKALDMTTDPQSDLVRKTQRQLLLAYNDFAVHCYSNGAYHEGVMLLNKVLREEQKEKGLYINRGDCFFQIGNLAFAEADYKEALMLNPMDEGANMRMGLLQERMGFCEQKRRQFQKAEDHFSVAIQHNPKRAQYYLYRAKSRQLLQDNFGARQDIATSLILNPNQPKLISMMANLFPGMTVKEVLATKVAHLAKLELERTLDSDVAYNPTGILGQLRVREMERQKARDLQVMWNVTKAIPESLQAEPEGTGELTKKQEGEPTPQETSPSESYLDQTVSSSMLSTRTVVTSDTGTSATSQEYKSTSSTEVLDTMSESDSSLLQSQSLDSLQRKEHPGKTKVSQDLRQSSKTKAVPGQSRSSSIIDSIQGQGQGQSASKTEATQGPKKKLTKRKGQESPRQRRRGAKATPGLGWRAPKATSSQKQGTSKTRASNERRWSLSNSKGIQSQRPNKAEADPKTASSANQVHASWGPKIKTTQAGSSGTNNAEAGQVAATSCSLKGTCH